MTSQQTPIIIQPREEESEGRRGCSGCLWGVGGALGCLGLLLLPVVVALILGMTTVNSVINNIFAIFNPPPPTYVFDTSALVLEKVKTISQLTTTRYNYSSIVTATSEMPALIQALYGRQLVLIATGHINAGVDLNQLKPQDVTFADGVLTITLPAPSLQDCFLNEQETRVVSQTGGPFAHTTGQNDLDEESRRYAVRQFRDMALEEGILDEARIRAEVTIQQFVGALGINTVKNVKISTRLPDSSPPLPASCR